MSGSSQQRQPEELFLSPTDTVFWVWNSSNAGELVTEQSGVSEELSLFSGSCHTLLCWSWWGSHSKGTEGRSRVDRNQTTSKAQKHYETFLASTTNITAPTVEGGSTWTSVIPWGAWQRDTFYCSQPSLSIN